MSAVARPVSCYRCMRSTALCEHVRQPCCARHQCQVIVVEAELNRVGRCTRAGPISPEHTVWITVTCQQECVLFVASRSCDSTVDAFVVCKHCQPIHRWYTFKKQNKVYLNEPVIIISLSEAKKLVYTVCVVQYSWFSTKSS